MAVVLGIDGGGTKTVALLADEAGRPLAQATGGPTNHYAVGPERAGDALRAIVRRVLGAAGLSPTEVACAVLGMAGVDRPDDVQQVCDWVRPLGLGGTLVVENDAVIALAGATLGRPGVVVVAGTGSVAFGVNARGERRRAGGYGHLVGDEGSGFAIGRAALAAVLRAHDGRGPATRLTELLLSALGVIDAAGLMGRVYYGMERRDIAALAPLVAEAARSGDGVAAGILAEAGHELGLAARAVIAGLGLRADAFEVAAAGGVFKAGSPVLDPFTQVVTAAAPRAAVIRPRYPPAVGAVILGLRCLNVDPAGLDLSSLTAEPASEVGPAEAVARPGAPADLDLMSLPDLLARLLAAEARVPAAVGASLDDLASAVERLVAAIEGGGRVFYVGAGTSGRLGALDATELPPTFGVPAAWFQAVVAGGRRALWRSVEGAEDDEAAGERDLAARGVGPGDAVVGLSASGRTPYTLGALAHARRAGATTVAVTTTPGSPLARLADVCVCPAVGPEEVEGSTRLSAGTAEKVVLNLLSTATMARLGRVYGNLMVSLEARNSKLRARAVEVVGRIAGVGLREAEAALQRCGWQPATAVLMLRLGLEAAAARRRLRAAGGSLRRALGGAGPGVTDQGPVAPGPPS